MALKPKMQAPKFVGTAVVERQFKAISRAYSVLKEDEGLSLRGLFIIDPLGMLRQITVNNLPVGRSVNKTLRLLQALQFTDEHGEVRRWIRIAVLFCSIPIHSQDERLRLTAIKYKKPKPYEWWTSSDDEWSPPLVRDPNYSYSSGSPSPYNSPPTSSP